MKNKVILQTLIWIFSWLKLLDATIGILTLGLITTSNLSLWGAKRISKFRRNNGLSKVYNKK